MKPAKQSPQGARGSVARGAATASRRPLRVGLISLGCAKNLVDSEIMLGSLLKSGIEITSDPACADALIVNTCSFIDSAQEESVDAILESAQIREAKNRGQGLIVAGCLTQRFRDELPKLLPEVDAFMGIDELTHVPEIVKNAIAIRRQRIESKARGSDGGLHRPFRSSRRDSALTQNSKLKTLHLHDRPGFIPDFATPRFRLTPKHFAYLKIAEGCNHPCSFCIIPRMRGSHRSRRQADVIAEARALIADGVKEINLISQDSTYYGLDLRPNHSRAIASPERFSAASKSLATGAATICTLLRELNGLDGDFWIRLLYTHPAHWTDELISTMAACRKVARYVDIPLQHIHDNMLERMRRETSEQYIRSLIGKIRAGIPGIALRTTFIVGFPGETEACFETLLDFIRDTRFERLGIFTYSKEGGTRAGAMAGQIPERVKQIRRDRAMAEQHKIARQYSRSFVGRRLKVLVEGEPNAAQLSNASIISWEHGLLRDQNGGGPCFDARDILVARSEADAPDIDGRVFVRGKLPAGEFATVQITGHADFDLMAGAV